MVKTSDEIIPVDEVVETTSLQVPNDLKLSSQEQFVLDVLKNYKGEDGRKVDPESLIKEIIEDSDQIMSQNARGDVIPDYKSRAQLKLELLRAAGIVKKNTPEVKINFLNLLFGNKNGL